MKAKTVISFVSILLVGAFLSVNAGAKALDKVAAGRAKESIDKDVDYFKEQCGGSLAVKYDPTPVGKFVVEGRDSANLIELAGTACGGFIRIMGDLCNKRYQNEKEAEVFKETLKDLKTVSCEPWGEEKKAKMDGRERTKKYDFSVSGSTATLKYWILSDTGSDAAKEIKAAL